MQSCEQVKEQLSDAIDGQLPWWRLALVRVHVAMCDQCGPIARSLSRTVSLLGSLRDAEPLHPDRSDADGD